MEENAVTKCVPDAVSVQGLGFRVQGFGFGLKIWGCKV